MLPTLETTRYVTPFREGGSLPALAQADDGELYVVKFRGAGQGVKALVAELIAGEIARALGLNVPPLALMHLDPAFGTDEGDPEIQDLLRASSGLNLGMRYLPGALMFDPLAHPQTDSDLAARIVWLDALVMNPDRTLKNPNLLCWHDQLWLIDHGAALYFHHNWNEQVMERSRKPFARLREHVLLPFAAPLDTVDESLAATLTPDTLERIIAVIPDEWLTPNVLLDSPAALRQGYLDFLTARLTAPRQFLTNSFHE